MMVLNKGAPNRARRLALGWMARGLILPLAACGKAVRKEIWLNVEMVSYLDRPIFHIIFNGTDLGVMDDYGSTGTITEVRIPFGIQALKWSLDGPPGTPRNVEIVTARSQLIISPEQISPGTRYLGIHLYHDDTVEFNFAEGIPDRTARGRNILAARRK
jgi:hypothetical protein